MMQSNSSLQQQTNHQQRAVVRSCCRLCLAPESECVSIFQSVAADKEALNQKILSCVRIKVQKDDRLSPKICHACISYLNSWQSFKNRCDAAQKKQRMWMNMPPAENKNIAGNNAGGMPSAAILHQRLLQQQQQQNTTTKNQQQLATLLSQNRQITLQPIQPKTNLLQQQLQKQSQPPRQPNLLMNKPSGGAESFIKQEPADDDDEEAEIDDDKMDDDIDPTQFLARDEEDYTRDDDEPISLPATSETDGPPILTSLGLTHINAVNPYGSGMNSEDESNASEMQQSNGNKTTQNPASCSICDMKFSNRANARRHERNIHGVIMNPLNASNQSNQSLLNGSANATSTPKAFTKTTQLVSLIKKVKTPLEVVENWDYSEPQKYRSYLTAAKLSFILQNLEFLEQAQNMTCKCCSKAFPSYKFFMGHMRKKYHNLPRNVCFKCLKHFESKGQFIGHLKRKTCLNLFLVVMNDNTINKEANAHGKGARDLLVAKSYACKLCPKKYQLKRDLVSHVFELKEHPEYLKNREDEANMDCSYCNKSFEDLTERKRHYNNLECISYLICSTCDKQLPHNQAFVDHVYLEHIKKNDALNGTEALFDRNPVEDEDAENLLGATDEPLSMSKQPQSCPVCDKQYNNYYNVLRHMESKHPDQVPRIYECAKCFESFVRQSELRDHVQRVHNMALISGKYTPLTAMSRTFICRECGETFTDMSAWIEHQVLHSKFNCNQCEFACEDRSEFEDHLGGHIDDQPKLKLKLFSCKICPNSYNTADGLREHMAGDHNIKMEDDVESVGDDEDVSMVATSFSHFRPSQQQQHFQQPQNHHHQSTGKFRCRYCAEKFLTKPELQTHMLSEHGNGGTQLLTCGVCQAEFVNDKGLKVHLWRSHQLREPDYGGMLPQISQSQTQPIKNKLIVDKEYECDICHIVYKSREQLRIHASTVHGFDGSYNESMAGAGDDDDILMEPVDLPNIWYQCRYCDQGFMVSNDLIQHMEAHEEDNPQDYTCKECGTLYSAKKDLWAHRYKNHPRLADPSPCDICKRTFFDKTEIYYHNMHAHTQSDFLGVRSGGSSLATESPSQRQNFPQFGASKQLAAVAAAAATPSAGNGDSSFHPLMQFYEGAGGGGGGVDKGDTEQEYACDMCPKTFPLLNALQVHRGWHFRSPDGRKVRDPADMWQPDQQPPSKAARRVTPPQSSALASKQLTSPNAPTCPYCNSKFASGNNLRRHIVEVHKRNDAKLQRESSGSPAVFVDRPKECQGCNMTFNTIAEWVDHKISHARTVKPSSTFEWGCEICGKMFTRKERLLQHMITHLNDNFDDANGMMQQGDDSSQFENSRSSSTTKDMEIKEEETGFSCELCQVDFSTAQELRKHVTEHFVNNGKEASSSQGQSGASSSDESAGTQESTQKFTAQEQQAFAAISQELKCRICGSECKDQLELVTCMASHQVPTNLKCSECQIFFSNAKQVYDHESLYHPKNYI